MMFSRSFWAQNFNPVDRYSEYLFNLRNQYSYRLRAFQIYIWGTAIPNQQH